MRITWGGVVSDYFSAVKQGGVLSPVLYCVYIDDLLLALSNSGVGCYIGNNFVGALAYANDIVLIAPTATAMRKRLSLSPMYVYRHNTTQLNSTQLAVELVQSFRHLGHTITSQLNDVSDITAKQNTFIGQTNNVLCFFQEVKFEC